MTAVPRHSQASCQQTHPLRMATCDAHCSVAYPELAPRSCRAPAMRLMWLKLRIALRSASIRRAGDVRL